MHHPRQISQPAERCVRAVGRPSVTRLPYYPVCPVSFRYLSHASVCFDFGVTIAGMFSGYVRALRFGRRRFSDLAEGMAMLPRIMAAEMCKGLIWLATKRR